MVLIRLGARPFLPSGSRATLQLSRSETVMIPHAFLPGSYDRAVRTLGAAIVFLLTAALCQAQVLYPGPELLTSIDRQGGATKMENALWGENAPERIFGKGRRKVVVADIQDGPGVITMMHFAFPEAGALDRSLILRIWWDGEAHPSVEAPLTDFFGDPNGALNIFSTALTNKNRGWNCYFMMPFHKSARVELDADNPRYAEGVFVQNPCYSYVLYRKCQELPQDLGLFHASYRQGCVDFTKQDLDIFEATGTGCFIGWSMTDQRLYEDNHGAGAIMPDINEKFYINGAVAPAIEWQGLEDSFGFSWGFPPRPASTPMMGYQNFYDHGIAAYRWMINDRISFQKSLRLGLGFGRPNEIAGFARSFPGGMPSQISAVAYWYQNEPHKPFAPLPAYGDRIPAQLPEKVRNRKMSPDPVSLTCGKRQGDIEYLRQGWDFRLKTGNCAEKWRQAEIKHCWNDAQRLEFDILTPAKASGTLKLFILDGDQRGREETITVEGRPVGRFDHFEAGRWVEVPVSADDAADGRVSVAITPQKGNAVVSLVRFVETKAK
jgi:hypothetical protein